MSLNHTKGTARLEMLVLDKFGNFEVKVIFNMWVIQIVKTDVGQRTDLNNVELNRFEMMYCFLPLINTPQNDEVSMSGWRIAVSSKLQ
jgi:hypothetical protein